jgi:hypothetical protein
MRIIAKRKMAAILLFFAASAVFAEDHLSGKMLIMGWQFAEEDTPARTNIAIDAMIKYAEAAEYQMSSEIPGPSCRIELYKSIFSYDDADFVEGVYIYINSKNEDDYRDRYIEINFYIFYNGLPEKYKLVLNYNNYNWLRKNDEKRLWTLVMRDKPAYDFFVSEIEKLRR